MKSNTKNTTKKTTKKTAQAYAVGSREGMIFASVPYTLEDFKNALLIVSLLVNAAVLILWILTQVHTAYAVAVADTLLQ